MTKYELGSDYPSQSRKEDLTDLGQAFLDFISSNQSPGQNRHIAEMELRRRLGITGFNDAVSSTTSPFLGKI